MFLIIGDTTVACQGLRPGPYSITATVSGYQPLALDGPFQVTGLGTPFTGILTATPEDVSGTVTSGTSPVANVSVAATNQSTGEVTTTLTDASGNYTLRSLAPVNYTVSFTKATYAPLLNVALNLQPGMAPPRLNERITQYNNTLTGQTFAQFSGTLERPLPGVVVKLEDPTSRTVLRQTVSAQAGPTGPATYSIPTPTSDPAPLLDGTYLVVFDHVPGYNAPIPINVTMSGGNMYAADGVYTPLSHNVKVTVQSSVGPTALAGASVTLTPVAGGTGQAQGPQQTGFDGTTFFNQVIPGDYTIVVDGTTVGPVPHLSPPPTPLTVPFDDSTTTQMPPTVTINEMEITGVASVNDGTGAQGSGAVKVTINPGNVLPPVQSDGTYGVFLTPAGYDVGFSAPGYVATSQHVNSNSAKNTVSATLIPKKHSVTVNVTSNVGGGPISGALVTLTPVAGGTGSPVPPKTTVAGTVIFTNVVPGDYTLAVDGTGIPIAPHATASQPFTLPIADADPAPVAVKVSEGLITGTVTNSSTTSPVPGVTVQVLDQNQQVVETATTLRDGTYKVYVTPGASFDVMFSMSGFNSQTKTNISVSDGQTISPPLNVSLVSN
ncbi:MAG: carboxypeptidase regulatory-like domain-containing protein [Actinomycetota bacterium]|nr:carboxypeptidase regulatory-like domain-containing protein [Actinomycetota bacterium]